MRYQLNTESYHNFDVCSINREQPRSYFIPYPDRASAAAVSARDRRYCSGKVRCLNGKWDFKFYHDPNDLPSDPDTETIGFDTIDVPSCWQFRGYDRPFYVNTRYQFPYDPPRIPTTGKVGPVFSWVGADQKIGPRWTTPEDEYNFVGVYRRTLTIGDLSKHYILSFLGAASCIDLYVNGVYAGYSEGSHNTAEFVIDPHIREGENEILVVIHRWCTGSYLEAQDMFRNNGIFRDVLLYELDEDDLWDIGFKTTKTENGYEAVVDLEAFSDTEVKVSLEGHGLSEEGIVSLENRKGSVVFKDLPVREWNAEKPVLYDLFLETPHGCVLMRVGFRDVTIKDNKFYLNGRLIKLRGVNHHDTSPVSGYTMTPEEIEKDVRLCKEYNIDTIRTSHYPPDPFLLEMCDELGIYVVDETDLETHGVFSQMLPPSYNRITNDPKWGPRCVDRVSRMYQRDKTHPCIVMWSLGNEAGGYACTDMEYDYLKERSDLPVHYESVIHTKRVAYDVASQMYPPVLRVKEVGEGTCKIPQLLDRPYFMCEYAHAMGVGPGNIEAYWEQIYEHDNLMGGCVWEMVDHAVLTKDGEYLYGGDHGEWEHDGNFCVDGIFYPDRTPSTGADIVRHAYRPLRVSHIGGKTYEVFNTTGFSHSSHFRLECRFSDGGRIDIEPNVHPLEKGYIQIDPSRAEKDPSVPVLKGDLLLTIDTRDLRTDRIVSTQQLTVEKRTLPQPDLSFAGDFPVSLQADDGKPEFNFDSFTLRAGSPFTILWRAATDNDVYLTGKCVMDPFYAEQEQVISVREKPGKLLVRTKIRAGKSTFLCSDYYVACKDGIMVTSRLHPLRAAGILPRFGKTFILPESFDKITYQGRSGESYCDMKDQYPVSFVSTDVGQMTTPNIRPQESGNRCDTAFASFSDGTRTITFAALDRPFELSVKPCSDEALRHMRHRSDVERTGTYVTIQAFQMGIGTGSCGPRTAPEYTYPAGKDYELRFLITEA